MANELNWRHTATGATVYATIRAAARTYWNGSALEALTVANWGNYDIALTETPASSYFYVGSWPAALTTAGWYWVDVFSQAGGSPAIGDTMLGTLVVYWDGTEADPWDSSLSAAALDTILVESGIVAGAGLTNDAGTQLTSINARQALAAMLSALAGVLAGAATTTVTVKPGALPAGNTRVSATVDADGNRSAVTLKVPT